MFLRGCSDRDLGGTRRHGVLSLPIMPFVVRRTCQRFTLWKPDAVRATTGAEHVGMFQKTSASQRQYCKKCGGHLMTNHPPLGLVDVFAATLPTLKLSPGAHINYAETVLPIRDRLPSLKIFPAEFGG